MDLETLIANLPPEAIAALAAGQLPTAGAKAKAPRATKPAPAPPAFRELKAPPIVEPRRAGPVTGQRLALDRFTVARFERAAYQPEHYLGQFPAIGAHGADISHLLGTTSGRAGAPDEPHGRGAI